MNRDFKGVAIFVLVAVFAGLLLGGGIYDLKTVSRGDSQPWVYRLNKWTGSVKIVYPGTGEWIRIEHAN